MTAYSRLITVAVIILFSAAYAVLVKKDPALASSIAAGYVAVLLSVVIVLNLWKKP
jgi:hypothetical protein